MGNQNNTNQNDIKQQKVLLRLKNIKKSFTSEDVVLDGIDLDIYQGEFLTILGASGCGKTTTLRIIAGLEMPDSGEVWLNGKDVTFAEPNKRDINTVFQSYALFPHMTVAQNIAYGLKLKKVPKEQIKKDVKQVLELVQLSGFEKRKPSELSGGQRQRVALARALVNKPQVVLLDEPLGALDLQLRRSMQVELKNLQKSLGITFVYITHDQEEAVNMSDRIAIMNQGNIEQIDSPEELYKNPKTPYVANFIHDAEVTEAQVIRYLMTELGMTESQVREKLAFDLKSETSKSKTQINENSIQDSEQLAREADA